MWLRRQLSRLITLKSFILSAAEVRSRVEHHLRIRCCHDIQLAQVRALTQLWRRLKQGRLWFEDRIYTFNIVILGSFALILNFRQDFREEPMLYFKCCLVQHIYVVFVFSELLMLLKEIIFIPGRQGKPSLQNSLTPCFYPRRIN